MFREVSESNCYKIKTSIDIFGCERCKITFGFKYTYKLFFVTIMQYILSVNEKLPVSKFQYFGKYVIRGLFKYECK